jgi:hypothetical protein
MKAAWAAAISWIFIPAGVLVIYWLFAAHRSRKASAVSDIHRYRRMLAVAILLGIVPLLLIAACVVFGLVGCLSIFHITVSGVF